jgi:hypothetical protein
MRSTNPSGVIKNNLKIQKYKNKLKPKNDVPTHVKMWAPPEGVKLSSYRFLVVHQKSRS